MSHSASLMESTPANFSTTMPLWNQCSSNWSSRRCSELRPGFPGFASQKAKSFLRVANRSGKLVSRLAATSPLRPCVLATLAMVTNASSPAVAFSGGTVIWLKRAELRGSRRFFFNNLQHVAFLELHAGCAKNGAYRLGGASLSANHFTQVSRGHTQL